MTEHTTPSLSPQPAKRQRHSADELDSPRDELPSPASRGGFAFPTALSATARAGQSSSFRNVSACNRCRLRKNRCDQRLPSCASCHKAGVACVGYDPITKKEIPRSYVFYLETRIEMLESLLASHDIGFPRAENLEPCSRSAPEAGKTLVKSEAHSATTEKKEFGTGDVARPQSLSADRPRQAEPSHDSNSTNLSKPKSLASPAGISFARVVLAAVQHSVSDQGSARERGSSRQGSGSGTSMRDSFFGLHAKPTIEPASFPGREVASRLVALYFEHANPQIPILHRGEFMHVFEQAYVSREPRTARELYVLNMVFAIGSAVIVGEPDRAEASNDQKTPPGAPGYQAQPEEYHASAIVHLEECLSSSGGGLAVLQAVLLLAKFALFRPVPPGLWYIVGVAVRLAVDLGLHYEDAGDTDDVSHEASEMDHHHHDYRTGPQDRGRRQWVRDMRRRLWWCTYSFDRLVSTCVGRPFGISDQVITTELPSLLDDAYITPQGFAGPLKYGDQPSYKQVAYHYFRLRMLQSEIMQVLQYNQAQTARAASANPPYFDMHALPCPFLVHHDSFRSWRQNIDRRLLYWKKSAPTREETGVAFSVEFLELNYWQAIILLYRQSLSVPAMFEGEYNTSDEVNSPAAHTVELREDEEHVYLKVAEAGQKILRMYRQLHLSGLVNYTYLSVHHLFMAGVSYLYAIWHSPAVRSRLTLDEVDFTVLAAKSVFTDLIEKCPPAETCRDAFDRTAKATIKMASSVGGFGAATQASWNNAQRPSMSYPNTMRRRPSDLTSADQRCQLDFRRRNTAGERQPFPFEVPMPEKQSPSTLSRAGDLSASGSPGLRQGPGPDGDGYMSQAPTSHMVSPGSTEAVVSQEGQALDPVLGSSPRLSRRQPAQMSPGGNALLGQPPFGQQQRPMDYSGAPTAEFMNSLTIAPNNGELANAEAPTLDLGFGINWESGFANELGEPQQINPFDSFFFGSQQGSGGNMSGKMNGM